jgi:uncharacterized protein with FMN-binding domain
MARLGITLLLICGIAGLGLAVVYDQTKPIIEKRAVEDALTAAKAAIPGADEIVEQTKDGVTYWLGKSGGETVGAAMKLTTTGYNGSSPIELVVGLDATGKVSKVIITSIAETAGVGSRIKDDAYLAKYTGVSSSKEVDTISGATISSKALQAGVTKAVDFLSEFVAPKQEMVIDFAKVPDGTYKGTGEGFMGPIEVEVKVAGGKVTSVTVLSNQETPDVAGGALSDIPKTIVSQQKADVDAVSGATFASKGIIEAVKNALAAFAAPSGGAAAIDVTKIADGTYTGTDEGFMGPIKVEVKVAGGKITAVTVLSNQETPDVAAGALKDVPKSIVDGQKVDVDVVSGATFASKGIIGAVKNALAGAPTK